MSIDLTRRRLVDYFTEKFDAFGPSPKGVDYNGPEAQAIRFEQLIKVIDPSRPFSVIDYGCGYGALFDFIYKKGWEFKYYGIDLIEKMVSAGRELHKDSPNAHFSVREGDVPACDYLLAGAIFNIKLDSAYNEWQTMITDTLHHMNGLCRMGFSFNMLTKYSDEDRMAQRPDLFFGDPLFFFDFCKRNFSQNVALLHDYGIYDFTILVRKDV